MSFEHFTKKIFISAKLQTIYWCWACTNGYTSWFLQEAQFYRNNTVLPPDELIQAGDNYSWKWHNWNPKESGTVLEANGKDKIVFSFAGDCKVMVTLKPKNNSVLVTLTQFDIPVDDKSKLEIYTGCSNGWTFWLTNLKAFLEHNILLNETKINLSNEPLAGFQFVNI